MTLDRVQDHLLVGMERTACSARLVGAAFLLPFLFFLWRGWIEPRLEGAAVGHLSASARCWAPSAGGWWRRASPAA